MDKFTLTQMHIECARNSTDDFNLFHDKSRWQKIVDNPFGGPIALGFQLACFIEHQVKNHRITNLEKQALDSTRLYMSEFELMFAGIVKPGDDISINIKSGKSSVKEGMTAYSNRVALKSNGKTVLLGFKRETDRGIDISSLSLPNEVEIASCEDRSFSKDQAWFIKRKYMIVGNAKNFLTSAFAEQSEYIDEFDDKIEFPQTYPLSLISSALLERAKASGHDLVVEPMIYTSQRLAINKSLLNLLKSNDCLTILVNEPAQIEGQNSTGNKLHQTCIGLIHGTKPLFKAEIELTPLSSLLSKA